MNARRRRPTGPPPELIEALEEVWRERGRQAIATIREYDPGAYVRLLAALVLDNDD